MKTSSLFTGLVAVTFTAIFVFSSCEKNNDNELSSADIELAEDAAYADLIFEDVMNEIDAAESSGTLKSTTGECAIIDIQQNDTICSISIDYGEGCEQIIQNRFGMPVDTIVRQGKIRIERHGRYRQQYSYRTVTLEDYSVNGIQLQGTRTVKNMGLDQNLHMWFTVELENGKITTPDGIEITRNSHRERHWVAGEDTEFNPWDDEYKVVGSAEGVTANGENYQHRIMDSLHIKMACRFIVAGQIEFRFGDREPAVLDFGNGDCDGTATLSRDGYTREIALKFTPRPMWRRVLRFGQHE